MDNQDQKQVFQLWLGRFVIAISKIQNALQEGICLVISKRLNHNPMNFPELMRTIKVFMHRMELERLKDVFTTLCCEHANNSRYLDPRQIESICKVIATVMQKLQEERNTVVHGVWNERFWDPGTDKPYVKIYQKNQGRRYVPEEKPYSAAELEQLCRESMMLERYIVDLATSICDSDSIPDTSIDARFEFDASKRAVFPRSGDEHRFKNVANDL